MMTYRSKGNILKKAKLMGDLCISDLEAGIIWDLAYKFVKPSGFALEVGSWKGYSAYIIASVCASRNAKLICVDSFTGDLFHTGMDRNFDFLRDNILKNLNGLPASFIVMDSTEAYKILKDKTFDMVFVDGDHTEPVISQDIKNYFPKVKPGGVYCGHDYGFIHPDKKHVFNVKNNVDKVCGKVEVIDTIWFRRVHTPAGTTLRKLVGKI